VVREDGGMGGYRWGVQRKQTLLGLEQENASDDLQASTGR
jgi:hypothetical protein